MSGSGPKTKGTDKIKFFKIDRGGDIAPAFPKDGEEPAGGEPNENTFARIEPIFDPEAPLAPEPPLVPDGEAAPEENPFDQMMAPDFPPMGAFDQNIGQDSGQRTGVGDEPVQNTATGIVPAPVAAADPQLEVQIDLLKPQIDSMSRLKEGLSSDQVDVLRRYITLKEAEVRDLRDQHRQYQAFLKKVSGQLETLTRRNRELLEASETMKRESDGMKADLRDIKDRHQGDMAVQKNEYEDRMRRSGKFDAQADEFYKKREEWKEKVREELKRVKLKERELENRHELLKRDMQALLDSKDKHMLEVKKKNDALELELETLEDRLRTANVVMASIDSKKKRLVETMKLAISLLEEIDRVDGSEDSERKAG